MNRYLILVENRKRYVPSDRGRLIRMIKRTMPKIERINIRISPRYIEIDIHTSIGIEGLAAHLGKIGLEMYQALNLDVERPRNIAELCRLIKEYRYWEAHEILEDYMDDEHRGVVRWLIRVLAMLVKVQMDQMDIAEKIRSSLVSEGPPSNKLPQNPIDLQCVYMKILEGLPEDIYECCIKT